MHRLPGTPLTILHTPGHTPDELAIYDEQDQMLYVGDTTYETAPIIFPNEGSISQWMMSMDDLIHFVTDKGDVKINAGHETYMKPVLEVLTSSKEFMLDVLQGREPVKKRMEKRGETNVVYEQSSGKYKLICPERLIKEARLELHLS
ncbi:hypothetical protein ONZ45_g2165 [Pleurotus djamor]|nr:hypothetical protein ONZ45_g2165 [Pleurotus djamor]